MLKTNKSDKAARKHLARHSFETRQKALEIFKSGGGYKNCAKALGISMYTARDWHKSYLIGTFRTDRSTKTQSYSAEQKALVLKLRNELGKSYNQISQMTRVNRASVLQWIRQAEKEKAEKDADENKE